MDGYIDLGILCGLGILGLVLGCSCVGIVIAFILLLYYLGLLCSPNAN